MTGLFGTVLELSLVGSYCILLVLLVRLMLKRAPRWCSYALWAIVFLRLICPVFPETRFSLIPQQFAALEEVLPVTDTTTGMAWESEHLSGKLVQRDKLSDEEKEFVWDPQESADGVTADKEEMIDGENTKFHEDADDGAETDLRPDVAPPQKDVSAQQPPWEPDLLGLLAMIWLTVALFLAGYHIVSYWRLKLRVRDAIQQEPGVREVQGGHLSFVMGIWYPQIYLSAGLSEETRKVVLCHERVHLQRRDYLTKPLALAVCCIHWFNPLVWLAFYLMNRDCEMSCDEKVVGLLGEESKKIYSYALLDEATRGESRTYRKGFVCALLSFGEDSVKGRIRHVLQYKRVSLWISVAAVVVLVVLVFGLGSNPNKETEKEDLVDTQTEEEQGKEQKIDDPVQPSLSFLDAVYCRKEGYCFDGMELNDSYEEFYQKYVNTGFLDSMTHVTEPAGTFVWPQWNSGKWVSRDSGVAAGKTILQMVDKREETEQGTVDINGYYCFYNDGLMGAELMYTFKSGEQARSYASQLIEKLAPFHDDSAMKRAGEDDYQGYELGVVETDENHVRAGFVDQNGVYICVEMSAYDRGGSVEVFFRENLDYFLPGSKERSQYFVFDQSSSEAVTFGTGEFTMYGRQYVLELQLQNPTQEISRVPSPWSGYVWNGEGQLILRDAETGQVMDACKLEGWSEPLQFQEEFTIQFCDYNGDGTLEFLIGQYAGANYNVYQMYDVSGVQAIGYCEELGELMIASDSLSPILEYDSDGTVYYSYYDNASGEQVEQEAKVPWYSFRDAISGEQMPDQYPYNIQVGAIYEIPMGKDSVMYVQNITEALRSAAYTVQYVPLSGDLEYQYQYQEQEEGSFRLELVKVPEYLRTYRYWSEDGTMLELDYAWLEDIVHISYQQADWDYVGYLKKGRNPDLFVEDGSIDAARNPDYEYFTAAFHWMDQNSAGIDRMEWITWQDERWPEGQPGGGMLYNEETEVEVYPFAEDCQILRMINSSAEWVSDVTLEELARSMDGAGGEMTFRWEIGLNADSEIAWIKEGYQQ